ncbi:MAG: hypothetical protein AAF518_20635 [Spirochaetota bacterium]
MPILLFGPMVLMIREVADVIGIPASDFKGLANGGFGLYEYLVFASILWFVVAAWKLKDWDEKRGLPLE